ncbi:MAG: AAA family ATPase [Lachnospiraceae bacterium]|nr:AAA family ATPase [Lachnospiraceae bacterium]
MAMYEFNPDDAERFAMQVGIPARRHGRELIFKKCPYCGAYSKDRDKFSINLATGQFQCFRASCQAKGNMITLAKDFNFSLGTEADEYYRGVRRFKNISGHKKPETKPAAVAYMESRGISEEVTNRYNLTVQREHENVLVFPFYDEQDQLQFVKYRKTDFDKEKDSAKEWCEKDCKTILFGMNHCNMENETLIITEGQIDSLSLVEAGIENAVSVPTGANGFTWVPHCWDFLKRFKTLIVFGDYEHEHMTLLEELSQRFDGTVKHVKPEDYQGCKDANEILRKFGKQALVDAVNRAVPVEHPKIMSLAEVERVDMSKLEKFPCGLASLDRILGGFYFGQLILITGERGEGKSTLVSQFGSFAVSSGYNVFFYSGELMNWYFKAWFDGQVAGGRFINRKVSGSGFVSYSVDAQYMPAIEKWYRDKAYIYDNNILADKSEEDTLLQTMEVAIKQYGCRVLVIDNLMTAMVDDTAVDQYRQQTIFVNSLAKMAKQYNAVIFLIAHPRKKQAFGFDNDDVAGSSNITNLVDVVLRYSRPKGKDIPPDTMDRELTVFKNRLTGQTNRNGIKLFFQPESKRIAESTYAFDWEMGWEEHYEQMEFTPVPDGVKLPFD